MEGNKSVEDVRAKLKEASGIYQHLLQETHSKALLQNEVQTKRWEDYKRDHTELSSRLLLLRDNLSHSVMVPIGKRALMRGKLVHTNEVLVCLGDGWFTKQSAKQATEICHRRIQHCDEMLNKLKKEEELLCSRKTFAFESEAFVDDDETQEIVEPYNEQEEKQWKEKHRQKEKEYRQKLAELRKTQKVKIETEDDLWRRLDALDLQEELEDELNRMEEDTEDDEEEEESSSSDDDEYEDCKLEHQEDKNKSLQRRVSFKDDKDNSCDSDENSSVSDDNIQRIVFNHSDIPLSASVDSSGEITSPSDIYTDYLKQKTPKSILKPSSNPNYTTADFTEQNTHVRMQSTHVEEIKVPVVIEPKVKAVNEEVVEKIPTVTSMSTNEKPIISRFKAARMASKR